MQGYRCHMRVGKGSDEHFFFSFLHFRDQQTTSAVAEQKIALFAFRMFKEMPWNWCPCCKGYIGKSSTLHIDRSTINEKLWLKITIIFRSCRGNKFSQSSSPLPLCLVSIWTAESYDLLVETFSSFSKLKKTSHLKNEHDFLSIGDAFSLKSRGASYGTV